MKLRSLEHILQNGPTDTGDMSTKEALIHAYTSVEENPNGHEERQTVLAILREILSSMI
jgi:hypothetical protein